MLDDQRQKAMTGHQGNPWRVTQSGLGSVAGISRSTCGPEIHAGMAGEFIGSITANYITVADANGQGWFQIYRSAFSRRLFLIDCDKDEPQCFANRKPGFG